MIQENIEKSRKKIIEFLRKHQKISLFYHLDCDGIVSAALAIKGIKTLSSSDIESEPINYEDFDQINFKEGAYMFLDVSLPTRVYSQLMNKDLCIIDHHTLIENSSQFVYVNPKMWGDYTYTPASLITYLLFENEVREYDWMAAVGVVSDAGGKSQASFIRKTAEKYGIKLNEDDPFSMRSRFGEAANMINSLTVEYNKEGAKKALAVLLKTKTIDELINNEEIKRVYEKVNGRIERLLQDFDKKSEVHENIFFFDVPKKYSKYSSTIATILGLDPRYFGKVIVIGKDIGDDSKRFNIRANGVNVNLNDIVKRIISEIGGEGGGHDKAVGAVINKEYEETFRRRLSELIQSQQS
ncbi:MAG: DHHA1 domain-containing protein [Nanoarchaeota archaeon]|nr:DHHA1 domain-containing protein [Nanoarchaeota archaeon]